MICSAVSAKLRLVYSCLNTSNYLVDTFDLSTLFWGGGGGWRGAAIAIKKTIAFDGAESGSTAHRSAVSGPPISEASRLLS